jgi:hypothetical protein
MPRGKKGDYQSESQPNVNPRITEGVADHQCERRSIKRREIYQPPRKSASPQRGQTSPDPSLDWR